MSRTKIKWRSRFEDAATCMHSEEAMKHKGAWKAYFGNDNPLTLELGCGKAELSLELARRHPDINYLGIDIKPDRLARPAQMAKAEGLTNIAFIHLNLITLAEHFDENEVDEIWITFPDPFPKKRQAKHRMTNAAFLKGYREVLKPTGKVQFKTDNLPLFQYSMEVFVQEGNIKFEALTFDLHANEDLPDDTKIETYFEQRFRAEGFDINYVKFGFVE